MRKIPDGFVEGPSGSYYTFLDGVRAIIKDGKINILKPHRAKVVVNHVYGLYEIRYNTETKRDEWYLIEEIERIPEQQQPELIPCPDDVREAIDILGGKFKSHRRNGRVSHAPDCAGLPDEGAESGEVRE